MIDKNQKIQDLKIGLWILLIFSVVINPFWSLVIGLVYYFKLKEVEISNSRYNLICGLILFIGVAGCVISGKGVSELWPDSLFLFAINSPRVVFLAIDLFILRYAWNLMTKKPEELMVIEEKKKQENAIPVMGYDDNNDRHILIAGTTGSGKTVVITNLIKNALKNGKPILIVNGKQDSHDTKGLYKVTKFLCEKYGVNCYLVSTDVNLKGTYSYKFSENRTKTNIINGFASSLRFEKDYYKGKFIDWMTEICKILETLEKQLSIDNILSLYDYEDFIEVAKTLYKDGFISEKEWKRLNRDGIKETAKEASSSKSKLSNLAVDEGEALFGRDKRISAEEVIAQKAVLIVEVNSMMAQEVSEMGAMLISADFASVVSSDRNHDQKKLLIWDEIGETFSSKVLEIYKLSRSFGFQAVIANQALSELETKEPGLLDALIENSNQFIFLRQNSPAARELIARIIGTLLRAEVTHRLDGVDYDPVGSVKIVEGFKVHPNQIAELKPRESFVYAKDSSPALRKVIWKWIDTSD